MEEINNEELQKDLEEQYAILEGEVQEDKKKKRSLVMLVFFLCLFLFMFGVAFSYYKTYEQKKQQQLVDCLDDMYVEGYKDAFKFDPSIREYVVIVKPKTTDVKVIYVLGCKGFECKNCKIEVTGENGLKPGDNLVNVKVTRLTDNYVREYIIHVVVPSEPTPEPPKPTTPEPTPPEPTPEKRSLNLISLDVKNHGLTETFDPEKVEYVSTGIKISEKKTEVSFELEDKRNHFELKLNGSPVSRATEAEGDINKIWFYTQTELHLGANKLEIIVKDDEGNSKTYTLFIVVEKDDDKPEVVEIIVDYDTPASEEWNTTAQGGVMIAQIVPGWESSTPQRIKITNNSRFNTSVDFSWKGVSNNFDAPADLEYELYKGETLLKKGTLPTSDEVIITNVSTPAFSVENYYLKYRYIYRDYSQNDDQGKEFKGTVNVTLSE